jgi:hypothetical protein
MRIMMNCPRGRTNHENRHHFGEWIGPIVTPLATAPRPMVDHPIAEAKLRELQTRPPNRNSRAAILAVLFAVLLIAGAMPRAGAAPLDDWWSQAAMHFQQIGQSIDTLGSAIRATDFAGISAGCQQLRDANAGLQSDMPTPAPDVTAEFQAMIDDIDAGSSACMSGNAGLATTRFQQAAAHYNTAKGILAKYGIQAY